MTTPSQPPHEPCDASILVRLPSSLKASLARQCVAHATERGKPVPLSEFARDILAAHAARTPCPCAANGPHCTGG